MAYSPDVINLFKNASTAADAQVGSFSKEEKSKYKIGTGIVGAPSCGDVMKLEIKVNDEGLIDDVRYKVFGCGSAIASSAYLAKMLQGQTVDFAKGIKNTDIAEALALPPVKLHCSILAEEAVQAALTDVQTQTEAKVSQNEAN